MKNFEKQNGIEKLLALKGKIRIDFDWENAEAEEINAAEEILRKKQFVVDKGNRKSK